MSVTRINVNVSDYLTAYTDIAYIFASCRARNQRLLALVPSKDCSRNKFATIVKRVLLEFKRAGKIAVYLTFSEITLDKTASRYILNLYPTLNDEINTDELGFIVKL